MDARYYGLVEMLLSFGVVLAFCFWQLHSVAKAKRKRLERERAKGKFADPASSLSPRHSERQHQTHDRSGKSGSSDRLSCTELEALAVQRVSE